MAMVREELIEAFRGLGDLNPEWSAESAIQQERVEATLARWAFLRGAWQLIASDTDVSWIDNAISRVATDSTAPLAGGVHAMRRLLAAGGDRHDIAAAVRDAQALFLAQLLFQMTEPEEIEGNTDANGEPLSQWGLFRVDPGTGEPIEAFGDGLHAEVNASDPTYREARPRPEPHG